MILKWMLAVPVALALAGCGGVREEAKVATAVQTIMVLAVEAAIRYNVENVAPVEPLECESGEYSTNADLSSIIDYLNGGADVDHPLTGTFDFDGCRITLCGETITLDGTASFGLTATPNAAGDREMNLSFNSDGITSKGIITGSPQFKYDMTVEAGSSSLGNVTIKEAQTNPKSFEYNGKIYRAERINDLAKGC